MQQRRSSKIQDFPAHASNVNCLKIGRKSSGVLVTGGDDCKVNMWLIGKSQAVYSLSGHQSPVECVTFDAAEEVVLAGSASGTIKMWDMEEARVVRTLTGHRSNCLTVDFHPFGEFFASGSLDTNLKVWDIRRKGCIHTYKGHTKGITALKFSPDGRWVVSGDEDGVVKLWDLTAGKILSTFSLHEGKVTGLEFHPREFLLGSSSADRTIRIWDLETFQPADVLGPESTPVRCMAFSPDGSCVLGASHEGLRAWSWEPARSIDYVDAGWNRLHDMAFFEGRLLGCAIQGQFVSVHAVDLTQMQPFSAMDVPITATGQSLLHTSEMVPPTHAQGVSAGTGAPGDSLWRKNDGPMTFAQNEDIGGGGYTDRVSPRPTTPQLNPPPVMPVGNSGGNPPIGSAAWIEKMQKLTDQLESDLSLQNSAAQQRRVVTADPAKTAAQDLPLSARPPLTAQGTQPSASSLRAVSPMLTDRRQSGSQRTLNVAPAAVPTSSKAPWEDQTPPSSSRPSAGGASAAPLSVVPLSSRERQHSSNATLDPPTSSRLQHSNSMLGAANAIPAKARSPSPLAALHPSVAPTPSSLVNASSVPSAAPPKSPLLPASSSSRIRSNISPPDYPPAPSTAAAVTTTSAAARPASGRRASDAYHHPPPTLNVNLNQHAGGAPAPMGLDLNAFLPPTPTGSAPDALDDREALSELMDKHRTVNAIYANRLSNLRIVRGFWQRKDVKGAIQAVRRAADQSVAVDTLTALSTSRGALNLDVFGECLPLLEGLLMSPHEKYVGTALDTLTIFLRSFGGLIRENLAAAPPPGIDLKFEERRDKCLTVRHGLSRVRGLVERHRDGSSQSLSRKAFELSSEVATICSLGG